MFFVLIFLVFFYPHKKVISKEVIVLLICNKVLTLRYIFVSSQDAMRYSLISLQLMRPCNCACRPCSGVNLAFAEVVCCLLFVVFFKENTNPRKYRISTVKSQPFLICKTVWKNLHSRPIFCCY